MKNKKAGLGDFAGHWIIRLILIAFIVAIVIFVVFLRFSKPYDIRALEGTLIAKESVNCLTSHGSLMIENFNSGRIEKCLSLDKENVLLIVQFKDKKITLGKEDLEFYCRAEEKKTSGNFMPFCLNQDYSVLDSGKLEKLNVLVALDKHEKNVK